jgi:hypothetical protein
MCGSFEIFVLWEHKSPTEAQDVSIPGTRRESASGRVLALIILVGSGMTQVTAAHILLKKISLHLSI